MYLEILALFLFCTMHFFFISNILRRHCLPCLLGGNTPGYIILYYYYFLLLLSVTIFWIQCVLLLLEDRHICGLTLTLKSVWKPLLYYSQNWLWAERVTMWIREAMANELLGWTEGWYRFPLWPRVSALLLERQMWFLQGSSSTWRSTVQRTSRQWPPQSIVLTQPLPSLVKWTIDLCAVLRRNPSDCHRTPERTNWALAAGHLICLTRWGEALWWMCARSSANDACSEVMSRVSSDVTPAGKLERWLPDGCVHGAFVSVCECVCVCLAGHTLTDQENGSSDR